MRRRRRSVLDCVATAFAAIPVAGLAPVWAYLATVQLAAWRASRTPERHDVPAPDDLLSLTVLIPAHDEERLVADAVSSVLASARGARAVDVRVIADHCTDATARVAQQAGATAMLHDDPEPRGKGEALQWAIDHLRATGELGEVVVILDADTVVDADFVPRISAAAASGARAMQAHYAVRDAESSSAASLRAAALAIRHFMRPLGRASLGGSCGLYGNGMAFHRDVLAGRTWSSHLTEDLEFQVELLLDGVDVEFVAGARLEAEMPDTLAGATTQNERWERGRIDLARRYVPKLARAASRSDAARRRKLADTAADLAIPPLSILVVASASAVAVTAAVDAAVRTRATRALVVLAGAGTISVLSQVFLALRLVGAPARVYRSLLGAPVAIWWKVVLWLRMLSGSSDVSWVRTRRNEPDDEHGGGADPAAVRSAG